MSLSEVQQGQAQSLTPKKTVTTATPTISKTLPSPIEKISQVSQKQQTGVIPTEPTQPLPAPPRQTPTTPLEILGIYTPERYAEIPRVEAGRFFVTPQPQPGHIKDVMTGTIIPKPAWTTQEKRVLNAPPVTIGQKVSQEFGNIGMKTVGGLWNLNENQLTPNTDVAYTAEGKPYLRQTGALLTYSPNTRYIMAEAFVNFGVGASLSGITSIAAPAAESLFVKEGGKFVVKTIGGSGRLANAARTVYTGSKIGMAGAFGIGTGAQVYDVGTKFQEGKITTRDVAAEIFTTGAGFVGFGAGVLRSEKLYRSHYKTQLTDAFKQASELNIRGGQAPEYGVFKPFRPGEPIASSSMNVKQNILAADIELGFSSKYPKIGEMSTRANESIFKRADKLIVAFEETGEPLTGKKIEIVSVGVAEQLNKIIPGVEDPIRADIFTTMKYRTDEIDGLIKSGSIVKYAKYEPEFTKYTDTTPWDFKKTPLKFEKMGEGSEFAKSSGAQPLGEKISFEHDLQKGAISTMKRQGIDIDKVTGFTEKSFTKEEMTTLNLNKKPGTFDFEKTSSNDVPVKAVKTNINALELKFTPAEKFIKTNLGTKATTLRGKIKNYFEPEYWKPKKQKIIPHSPDVELTGKIEIPFPSVEDVQGLNRLYPADFKPAKAIDTTPKYSHDIRQGAIDYLKGLKKYNVENKPKLNLKSNKYTGGEKTIGTTGGTFEIERPLSQFEKKLISSEIESVPVFNVRPPTSKGPTMLTALPSTIQLKDINQLKKFSGHGETQLPFSEEISTFGDSFSMEFRQATKQEPWITPIQEFTSVTVTKQGNVPIDITTPFIKQDMIQYQDRTFDTTFDIPQEYIFKKPNQPTGTPMKPIPPFTFGLPFDSHVKPFGDDWGFNWMQRITRERKHKVSDPFTALKGFKL